MSIVAKRHRPEKRIAFWCGVALFGMWFFVILRG